ncbi:MAG: tRNA (guanosine(46)-N7)-methyltransferase TrmB, partial [Paracoccaceae bacterium]
MTAPENEDGTQPAPPWRNFYGRRFGKKLRKGQAGLVGGLLRELEPPGISWNDNPDRTPLDLAALYPDAREIW